MSLTEIQALLCLGLIASTGIPANSESLSASHRLNGSTTRKAFKDSQEAAFASTVRLMRNGKLITHGTIISDEGHLLTKASACVGAREAVFANVKKYGGREGLDVSRDGNDLTSGGNPRKCNLWGKI